MRTSVLVSALGAASSVVAQNATGSASSTASATMAMGAPSGTSICNYYANALFGAANATTEYTLLTSLVNLAVLGNATLFPNKTSSNPMAVTVQGILATSGIVNNTNDGDHSDTPVNLAKYFDGSLASSNRNGKAVSVNFLDGGGATPLIAGKPADNSTSNQYVLLTHLYEYFGALLNCSGYGTTGFPAYGGVASMYEVHKFMDLSYLEVTYFIQEVAFAALWFGVAESDLAAVGITLGTTFNYKCLPAAAVVPANVTALQSICIGDGCQQSQPADCAAYNGTEAVKPAASNSSNVYTALPTATGGSSSGSGSGSGSGSSSSSSSAGAAAATVLSNFGPVLGFAGLAAIAVGM